MLSFEELTEARRSLQSFCRLHVPSLVSVQSGVNFKLVPSEGSLDDGKAHHLTTTATCYISLLECPPRFHTVDFERVKALRYAFAEMALVRTNWVSEGSAGVYCRCRALPLVISSLAKGTKLDPRVEQHVTAIFEQLSARPEQYGIGEAGSVLPAEEWYPPNAFHTFWAMEILTLLKEKHPADYARLSSPAVLDLKRRREGMLLWGRAQLGYQLGLHSAPSSVLDSDQLAWSLAILLRFEEGLGVNLENRDFVKQALKCLFSTQTDGTWRHYKPLFHYMTAGNAYCYVFETFAALLQCGLCEGAKAEMFRELLKPYCKNLMDLWRYADSTKIPVRTGGKEFGWCSGHRTNVTDPESWATASVFSYAQALRRLVGIWCREDAQADLKTPRSRLAADAAMKEIDSLGTTWGFAKTPVSERLWTMFINPVRMHTCNDRLEPDSQPIEKRHARSAILFGPPGTGKTSLVRVFADFIGWEYVELHASHFVAEGLGQVQKTADRIFNELSELDHTVVLFDEIDELVRERDMEKDAFGRFLTTSMLPKLAELWAARKILYFVATNHINYFDSAIIRSHRFDALMLVSPPSFQAKLQRLTELLSDPHDLPNVKFQVREPDIQNELEKLQKSMNTLRDSGNEELEEARIKHWLEQKLDSNLALAKFALIRYDELNELASRIASVLKEQAPTSNSITVDVLRTALGHLADSEWRKNKSYADYFRDVGSERRDYQMLDVWETDLRSDTFFSDLDDANGAVWLRKAVDRPQEIKIPGFQLVFEPHGRVKLLPTSSK